MITKFSYSMISEVIKLWNKNDEFNKVMKMMDVDRFSSIFLNNNNFNKDYTFVYKINKKIVGFSNGTVVEEKNIKVGYISFILVDEKYKNLEIDSKLLKHLEEVFIEIGVDKINISFYNPIKIDWYTLKNVYSHANIPGAIINSEFYLLLRNNGYNIYADIQDVYLLELSNYQHDERNIENIDKSFKIEFFDKDIHKNGEVFFDKLNSESWKNSFVSNSNKVDPTPSLIVCNKEKEIKGWIGSIFTNKELRGCFAGVAVDEEVSGMGLGKALFASFLNYSKNNGAKYITLFTGSNNNARHLYTKFGFKLMNSFALLTKNIKER